MPYPLSKFYGDARSFNGKGGTYRFEQAFILNNITGEATRQHNPGYTRNPFPIGGKGKRVSGDGLNSTACYQGNGIWDLHIWGNVKDPMTPQFATPGVTYDFYIHVTPNGTTVSAYNDGYPAFEIWRYSNGKAPSLKFGFMPPAEGYQGLRLFDVNPTMKKEAVKGLKRLSDTIGPIMFR